jgi:SAM-dependent methyltransferase
MERITEPELMDDPVQALAYTLADFSASHGRRVAIFQALFPNCSPAGSVLDLGCGSGDVLLRFARAFPHARFTGVDGAKPMVDLAQRAIDADPALRSRVQVIEGVLPECRLPPETWQLIMSHSLLHQLHDPMGLWRTIRQVGRSGCAVFVADLRRPASSAEAQRLVEQTSAHEPEILQRDFFNSLCAAFEPEEVRAQLDAAGLTQLSVQLQEPCHLTVHGTL